MHGATGRMGMNQHLIRSILEIRKQGGVALKDGGGIILDMLCHWHYVLDSWKARRACSWPNWHGRAGSRRNGSTSRS